MSLKVSEIKKILKAAGLDEGEAFDNAVDQIIAGNKESIEALREERNGAKNELATVIKELNEIKSNGTENENSLKNEIADIKKQFDDYKASVESEKSLIEKKALYKSLLKSSNIDEKRIDSIIRVTDFTNINVKDGKLENESDLKSGITKDWSDFVVSETVKGTETATPPENEPVKQNYYGRARAITQEYLSNLYGVQKTDKKE